MKRIDIVKDAGGDWVGLYINGKSRRQSHNLDLKDVLMLLGFVVREVEVDMQEKDWGWLPENIEDLY